MKPAIVTYLPPPRLTGAQVFLENVTSFATRYPLIMFSDHDWKAQGLINIKNPEMVKNATFPNGKRNPFAINNLLWLTALRIARAHGITHMLYLEHDCRVGCQNWDEVVFDEFFSIGRPLVAGGNLATYNPCSFSAEAARRWQELVTGNTRRNVPIPTYGWVGAAQKHPSCVFPNGALAIYSVAWMEMLFDNLEATAQVAAMESAFDMVLGVKLWTQFEERVYEVLGHLNSVFSGYGDVLTTEEERMTWLREGKYVAVHQIKSEATI